MTVRLITFYSKITDFAGVQEYVEKVGPVLDKFGVQRDFAGPVLRLVEGGPVDAAGVLIFPDVETSTAFTTPRSTRRSRRCASGALRRLWWSSTACGSLRAPRKCWG